MASILGLKIQVVEVYRNTPFEYLTTADGHNGLLAVDVAPTVAQPMQSVAGPAPLRPPPAPSLPETPEWLADLLREVRLEMLEDASDYAAAQKALADPRNKVRVPLAEVKKRLGL